MLKTARIFFGLLLVFVLTACVNRPGYQKPEVHLTKVEPLAASGLEQRFLIGLRIVNPNNAPLDIAGLSYSLSLQGNKVLSGVSSDIGTIAAYSDKPVELESSVSLIGSLRALTSIMNETGGVAYELETRIDTRWWPWPVRVIESGSIDLN